MIASSSSLSLMRSLRELDEPIRVSGLPRGAQALALGRWAEEGEGSPLLVFAPTGEAAQELADEIEALSESLLRRPLRVACYPGWDHSPYSSIAPSIGVRLQRISVLSRLAGTEAP